MSHQEPLPLLWFSLHILSHYSGSPSPAADVQHWMCGLNALPGSSTGIISLAATGMQTVNRESKQVAADRSSFGSLRSLVLDRPRYKTNDIQFYTTSPACNVTGHEYYI